MPGPVPFQIINGASYSFSSIVADIAGSPFTGITELNMDEEQDPGELRGTSPQILGATDGDYKISGSISMHKIQFLYLLDLLSAGGLGYMQVRFDIIATYSSSPLVRPTVDAYIGMKIKKISEGHRQGPDSLMSKLDLHGFYMLRDKKPPILPLRK